MTTAEDANMLLSIVLLVGGLGGLAAAVVRLVADWKGQW